MARLTIAVAPLIGLLPSVLAQGGAYSQCGGIGWTGATTCVSGYVCTYYNAYYSQCVPGTASATSSSTTSKASSTSTTSTAQPTSTAKPSYWFSFGDSYTQTGFDITSTAPSIGNPLGNPTYPGYTATGGENWIDAATTKYNHSLVLTYNFAYGGATIDAALVAPYESTVLSLVDQVTEFTTWNSAQSTKPWTSANALFSIWIGINDIGNSYYLSGDRAAFSDTLLADEFAQVQKLYDAGARNFLFINVPPVDRSPFMVAQGSSATTAEAAVIATHNQKIATAVSGFKANHTGVTTYLWDSNAYFDTILNNLAAYGFNTNNQSYGGSTDFWGNNYHPSSAAQVLFAQQVGQLLSSTVW